MEVLVSKSKRTTEKKEYPRLMIGNDRLIVLFSKFEHGTAMNDADHVESGYYCSDWKMDCFKPFDGSITLQND